MCLAPLLLMAFLLIFMAIILSFFLLEKLWCGSLLVHLVGVGVGELACFSLDFLPRSSPCSERMCGLPCGIPTKLQFLPQQTSSLH
jgi:hypothetical protein